jgi:tetratricopeptide (TPR) repeat protein
MALNPTDITVVSQLLDQALALPAEARKAWLEALPAEHHRHRNTLRDMLAQEAELEADTRLNSLPQLAPDESVAHTGDLVGPYRLIREIGRGGMGTVWLAERADGAYKRQVALKLPRLAWGAGLAERMAREREIGLLLEHPNIARLYDAGVDDRGRPYLALEYVDGQPIDAWCEAQYLNVRERLKLFVQVIKAVAYAHGRLVVHRDLKPSNVLVTPDGQAHLLDFGIAKLLLEASAAESGLTQEQGRVLTPHYASPEQVAGDAITVQSDVYSLGVLLYELLTSTLPIEPKRGTLGAVEEAILLGDAPAASSRMKERSTARALRGEVDAILSQAMQREPARRYATADAMALDIERHLNGETVAARPDSRLYRLRKAVRRNWVAVSAAAAVLLAVLSGSGVAVVQAQRAARAFERERVVKEFVADVFRVNSRVDPKNAAMRPASPQTLIENGAQLIQQRFAGQPALQAELFAVVGGVFNDMGAYKLAADYATRRMEALTTTRAEPEEQAQALLTLGQALFDDRRFADAEARAKRVIQMSPEPSATHIDALILVARIHAAGFQLDALAATLKEIDRLLAAQAPGPSVARSWALFLRARVLATGNRLDEALPIYEQAIDMALISEGPLSLTAVKHRLAFAGRLAETSYSDRAQRQSDAAMETLHKLGGAHEIRAIFQTARLSFTRLIGDQTNYDEVLATLEQSRNALASAGLPVPPWYLLQIDFMRAQTEGLKGNVVAGWQLMEAIEPSVRQAESNLTDRLALAAALGGAAMSVGRHELAESSIREWMALRRQRGQGNSPWAAQEHYRLALNLTMQGRTKEAEEVLDEAPRFGEVRGEGGDPARWTKLLRRGRAEARLAAGRSSDAIEILQTAKPAAAEIGSYLTDYRETMGEALCAAGRYGEGLGLLKQALAADEPTNFAHAPWLARRRALIGLCAAGMGDRRQALRHAMQAREDFLAQSEVSPYYKAPLIKLERALGLKLPPV